MRLLLVEDDPRIAHFVAKGLQEQSYAVDVVANGNDAFYQMEINDYDLVILDVMIPDSMASPPAAPFVPSANACRS